MLDLYVTRSRLGFWAVKEADVEDPIRVCTTKEEAEAVAKRLVAERGGGEVHIQGLDGRWIDSDTVALGNDPNPPKDTKH